MYEIIKTKLFNILKEADKSCFLISLCSTLLIRRFSFDNPILIISVLLIMESLRLTLEDEKNFKYKRFFYGFIFFIIIPLIGIISQNFLFRLFISWYASECINLLKKNNII